MDRWFTTEDTCIVGGEMDNVNVKEILQEMNLDAEMIRMCSPTHVVIDAMMAHVFPYHTWQRRSEAYLNRECSYCREPFVPNKYRPNRCDQCGGPR